MKETFMKSSKISLLLLSGLVFLLFVSSCAPEDKGGWVKNGTKTTRKEVFRKLKDYSLALIIMTPTVFFTIQRVFDWGDKWMLKLRKRKRKLRRRKM